MEAPASAPIVYGPIFPSSELVLVSGVLPNASVSIYAGNNPIGQAIGGPGLVWVPVTVADGLQPGAEISAKQIGPSGESPASNQAVTVEPAPTTLPQIYFDAPAPTQASDLVNLANLVPGATVEVTLLSSG